MCPFNKREEKSSLGKSVVRQIFNQMSRHIIPVFLEFTNMVLLDG